MYLYSIKLGEVFLLRTCDESKFELMLKDLKHIEKALTVTSPKWY